MERLHHFGFWGIWDKAFIKSARDTVSPLLLNLFSSLFDDDDDDDGNKIKILSAGRKMLSLDFLTEPGGSFNNFLPQNFNGSLSSWEWR